MSDLAKEQIRKYPYKQGPMLFPEKYGDNVKPYTLSYRWNKWCEKYGVDKTLHELRHTMITYSRKRTNLSLSDLKKIYGHSTSMDTDGTYVHNLELTPQEVEQAQLQAQVIGAVFEEVTSRVTSNPRKMA